MRATVAHPRAATHALRCVRCGATQVDPGPLFRCGECSELLEVIYPERTAPPREFALRLKEIWKERKTSTLAEDVSGVWRYRELLPQVESRHVVTMSEGNTPLLPLEKAGRTLRLSRLFAKHQGMNPTGSFKDTGISVAISIAKAEGFSSVCCASTGNTSASVAAYAARAGMKSIVLLPAGQVASGKLAQALEYGAHVLELRTDFDGCLKVLHEVVKKFPACLLNSVNPYRLEGQKTVAFEMMEQLGWRVPDHVIVPGGNLANSSALGKGFLELRELGLIASLPKVSIIQAQGANPLVRTMRENDGRELVQVNAQTRATAIRIGNPASWRKAVAVLKNTGGACEDVSEEEIAAAKAELGAEGAGCEPASAASLAGLKKLVRSGFVKPGETAVLVLTGHMLKDVDYMLQAQRRYSAGPVEPDVAEVIQRLEQIDAGIEEAVAEQKRIAGQPPPAVRVGIVGYGTVGRATAEILAGHAEEIRKRTDGVAVVVTRICRKTPRASETGVNGVPVGNDWREVVSAPEVDIVVESIGGTGTAYDVVRTSLENGKAVVTANKALIARYGGELFKLARQKNLPIGIEASVAGGVPVIRAISEALAADRIHAIYGIVNGTCNYILTQMEQHGIEFDQALKQAQAAGYAEADPSLDIDGLDARDKIAILARIAFGCTINAAEIPVTGIRNITATDFHYAHRLNSTIRLVASAERTNGGIHIAVQPWLEPRDSMLSKVDGANNAIFLAGEKVGTQMLYGRGAGGGATGTAVLSDVIEIAKQIARGHIRPSALAGFDNAEPQRPSPWTQPLSWFLRLTVKDRPGILARIAEAIAKEDINIDSVIQEPHMPKDGLSFVITVEPTCEPTVQRAVQAINQFEFMKQPVLLLPMISSVEEHV